MTTAEPIIEAELLCKDFVVSTQHGTLKRLLLMMGRTERELVRALNNISFRIHPGEAVALVGRNGSGKSTLLSLIGRIYLQTSGRLDVKGRVAPLLELGAGFHMELTGRENIYLNGVILGLTRQQVEDRMDRIIAFAELAPSIDSPIRNYSSGQLMRLGFAIASHTDSDILLVDEVLGPADEEFQIRCFERIREFQAEGRTILFVSHDVDAVREVARRAIWLDRGRLRADGPLAPIVESYLAEARHEPAMETDL